MPPPAHPVQLASLGIPLASLLLHALVCALLRLVSSALQVPLHLMLRSYAQLVHTVWEAVRLMCLATLRPPALRPGWQLSLLASGAALFLLAAVLLEAPMGMVLPQVLPAQLLYPSEIPLVTYTWGSAVTLCV